MGTTILQAVHVMFRAVEIAAGLCLIGILMVASLAVLEWAVPDADILGDRRDDQDAGA
jgi:hypothetical protein